LPLAPCSVTLEDELLKEGVQALLAVRGQLDCECRAVNLPSQEPFAGAEGYLAFFDF